MVKWFDSFASVIGRPRAIEGEQMVVSDGLMAAMTRPAQGGVYFLPVDEIIRRQGWKTYNEMLHDDQVKACLAFKKILVTGREYELVPQDENNPKSVEAAKFIEWCLNKACFDNALYEAASAVEYGYSLAELVWTRDVFNGKQVVCLEKIAHRDPRELYLQIDPHGNYTGVKQISMGQEVQLAPEKTWLYSYNKRFGNIYGDSDLRSAYRAWWAKKFIINFWNVFLERMGSPMMIMKYPQGASTDLKNLLKKILKTLASNTEVLVPEGVEVDLLEAQRSGNASYEEALAFHNSAIARSMLLGALLALDGSNTRTSSNGEDFIHVRLIFKMADMISRQLADSFMQQVARQLIALNYGEDQVETLMPRFVWQDYGQYQATLIADEIRQLHAAGIIDMDQTDVNYVRSLMGLKLREEKDPPDDVVRPAPLPPPGNGTPPPPAKQGNGNADKGGSAKTKDSTNSQ
jgi:phage gp29-like protein